VNGEPVVTAAAVQACISAVLGLLVAFGVTVTDAQAAAILAVWATVGPLLFAVATRRHVTPTGRGEP
jgi:hypothetical protein